MRKIDRMLQQGLYRSRRGVLLGVCRGIAETFDFSIFWTRAIALVLLFVTGLWPVTGLYLLAALLMRPEPVMPITDIDEQEFYDSYTHSRQAAVQRLKGRFARLDRRIQRMEHLVTSADFNWKQRMRS